MSFFLIISESPYTIPISIKYESDDFVIKSVNKGSFQGTTTVKSILFPTDSQVSVIEEDAFADSLIEHLVIPTSVTDLQDGWCRCTPKLF